MITEVHLYGARTSCKSDKGCAISSEDSLRPKGATNFAKLSKINKAPLLFFV